MDPPQFNFHMMSPSQQVAIPVTVPEPTSSPPQSVPGRRTPLGAVGLGGFYAQGHSSTSMHTHTDENRVGGTSRYLTKEVLWKRTFSNFYFYFFFRTPSHSSAPSMIPGVGKHKNRQGKTVRLNINAR